MTTAASRTTPRRPRWAAALVASAVSLLAGLAPATAQADRAPAAAAGVQPKNDPDGIDELVMRNGRVIRGRITEETSTSVTMIVEIGGIEAEATYDKINILAVRRDVEMPGGEGGAEAEGGGEAERGGGADTASGDDAASPETDPVASVYYAELVGEFGRDIVPEVLRDIADDAREYDPDFLIFKLDNEWQLGQGGQIAFDAYAAVEDLEPILTTEIEQTWADPPEIIFWVHSAMGGASMLPFTGDRIYFHPEGTMGGIGTLDDLFDGVGDEVVRQKQRSLRLARAQGIAIKGGYDYRLVNAMARKSYVLSYRLEGGRAVIFEGMPQGENEYLLTDDGEGDNEDTQVELLNNTGNDVLTLKGREAILLDVAEDTLAESVEQILDDLRIGRNAEFTKGDSDTIRRRWSNGLRAAERRAAEIRREMQNYQGEDAVANLGFQIQKYRSLQALVRRYGAAIDLFGDDGQPQELAQIGNGAQNLIDRLDILIEQLRIQMIQARQ